MNLLIYGSNGWIGNQVINYLKTVNIKYIKSSCRVDNIKDVETDIKLYKPTHVLSLIGRTHGKINNKVYTTIDYLEEPGKVDENIRDNLFSPLILAIICKENNIHFTYLGTGCIFEYDNDHPHGLEINGFTEESEPNFKGSSYSIVKGYTDRLMHLYNNVLNLRIRMPINSEYSARNFITKITNYEKICSIPNSMTVLPELIPLAINMLQNNIVGTINLTNPGLVSHNEILELYKEMVDPKFTWTNFSVEEQNNILSSKRSNNFLDTTKLESLYPDVMNIKDAVKECLKTYKSPNITNPPETINKITETINTTEETINTINTIDETINTTDETINTIDETINTIDETEETINTIDETINITDETINTTDETEETINTYETNILITGGCGFIASNFINYIYYKYDKINIINIDAMYLSLIHI